MKRKALYLAMLYLAACGGGGSGGDSDDSDSAAGPDQFQGFFLDDAVQGLIVETGTAPAQTTDENGVFFFNLNEPITFKVDTVEIGTVSSGLTRITPNHPDFGSTNLNVIRFLQSLDTTPGAPGIDLTNIDLPDVQINFNQGNDAFAMDPQVAAALQAAMPLGATGTLISASQATQNFAAGTSTVIELTDLANQVYFPVTAGVSEPCLVFVNDDNTGWNVCQDDVADDPADPLENFTWSLVNSQAILDLDGGDERVTISQLGVTGNRRHADVSTECLTCDPNAGPTVESELQTLFQALPISAGDFTGRTIMVTNTADGETTTAEFSAVDNTVTLTEDDGPENYVWLIDAEFPMLILEGVGMPGETELPYTRVVLIDGSVGDGTLVALVGEADDTNGDGRVDAADFAATGEYEEVAVLTSN